MVKNEEIINLLFQSENPKLEFKQEIKLDDEFIRADLLRHILSLVNSPGGTAHLLIGVEDKSKKVIGLKDDNILREESLQQLVRRYCTPPINFSFDIVIHNGLKVGVFTIPPSPLKPHCLSEDMAGRIKLPNGKEKEWKIERETIYIRRGSITDKATHQEIDLLKLEAEQIRSSQYKHENNEQVSIPVTFSPLPLSRGFIGRETELKQIKDEFHKSPIVLVEGLSGIGKTTLATKYIRDNIDNIHTRVFMLECQENTNIENVLSAFSDYAFRKNDLKMLFAINEERPIIDRLHNLIELLDERRSFIYFDVFERSNKESMLGFAQEILDHCQYLQVLICTQERPKEYSSISTDIGEIVLGGLDTKEAIELLKQLEIPESEISFEIIAQKTEGHPLAIRLFASLIRNYGLSPIELLSDSTEFGNSLEEQWLSKIYSHLSDDEKNMLERISIFNEPITREGIKFIVDNSEWAANLHRLQDKFLLNRHKESFSVHSLIRDFCYQKLQNNNLVIETAIKASEYYLQNLSIEEQGKELPQDDVKAKMQSHNYKIVAKDYFGAAKIVRNIQYTLMKSSQYSQIANLLETTFSSINYEKLSTIEKTEWEQMSKWFLYNKGRILYIQGHLDESLKIFLQLTSVSDRDLTAESIQQIANIYLDQKKPEKVIELFENNLEIFRSRQKRLFRMFDKIARVYIQRGELKRAVLIYKQLLDWQQADNDTFGGGITLHQMANIYLAQNDISNAFQAAELSYSLITDCSDQSLQAAIEKTLGEIFEKKADFPQAVKWFTKSFRKYVEIHNNVEMLSVGENLQRLLLAIGDNENYVEITQTIADSLMNPGVIS